VPRANPQDPLSRRERQIMEIVWRLERASAAEIQAVLPDPPSYSAVRALLAILVEKGHLKHEQDGRRYVYVPTAKREKAGLGALRRVLSTFFEDSPANLVATLLDQKDRSLPAEEIKRIRSLIVEHARRRRL
jgi:BlaI family transcriptional regulator, penicillinase repressor